MGKKTLCDWSKKDIKQNAAELLKIVQPANYICKKCARVANDKDYLCKAIDINKFGE